MKTNICTNCKKKPAVAYYKAKPVCKRCFEKLKWQENHCSIEEIKKICVMRAEKLKLALEKKRIDNPQSQKVYKCLPCKKGKGNWG